METADQRLQRIAALHFDPEGGSPYWLARQAAFGRPLAPLLRTLADLPLLGPLDAEALRLGVEAFLPSRLRGCPLVTGETGGATGPPKATAYRVDEFEAAFVTPFLEDTRGFSWERQGHWLWIAPSGPHLIGKAARRIAQETTASDGWAVDFDPRWFRRLAPGSLARERYLDHLLEQAQAVVRRERVRYLFATPAVLLPLAERLRADERERIAFVYLGGMGITPPEERQLRERFPAARLLNGYGNTLFGVCHAPLDGPVEHRLPGARLAVRLVTLAPGLSDAERLAQEVAEGQRGQVVMTRLDESCFLANVLERDTGLRLPLDRDGRPGIGQPGPLERDSLRVEKGIY